MLRPCRDQKLGERRVHIPAGGSVSFEISAQLPRGEAIAHVSVSSGPSLATIRESNPDDNDTTVVVGGPDKHQ